MSCIHNYMEWKNENKYSLAQRNEEKCSFQGSGQGLQKQSLILPGVKIPSLKAYTWIF